MMQTQRFGTDRADLERAAQGLRDGETVAFPTETVYGLGANALNAAAVDKIFAAKGRPSDNPLIVHIAHSKDVSQLAKEVSEQARLCMDHFWPGPLTLILPCTDLIPTNVTAGLDTVGIRMPDHETALQLIALAGVPLAAPSANRSGRPSPTTADHVWEDLAGRIAGVVDGGPAGVGVESTVLDVTGEVPMILRPGGITREMLTEILGRVDVDPALGDEAVAPRSPGVKYTHYAPKGTMYLVEGEQVQAQIVRLAKQAQSEGQRVGILTTAEQLAVYQSALAGAQVIESEEHREESGEAAGEEAGTSAVFLRACGERRDLATVAAALYDGIRSFDHYDVEVIYAETFSEEGVGLAVMNRLRKAAGHRVIRSE